jgi:hypothetical protein
MATITATGREKLVVVKDGRLMLTEIVLEDSNDNNTRKKNAQCKNNWGTDKFSINSRKLRLLTHPNRIGQKVIYS